MNPYLIIIALSGTYTGGATHAGLRQPPSIGGDWRFDLLVETAPNTYDVAQADCTAPAGEDITSLSEIAGDPVGSTFARDVNAQLFPNA